MSDFISLVTAGTGLLVASISTAQYIEERRRRRIAERDEKELDQVVTGLENRLTELESQLRAAALPPLAVPSDKPTLDTILGTLDRHHQRATYGAVATLLRTGPNILMSGRPRDHLHSWVVNRKTGLPTGYSDEERHPRLEERNDIIRDPQELAKWLQSNRGRES